MKMPLPRMRMRAYTLLLMMVTIMTTTITADGSELPYSDQETALRKELFTDYNPNSLPSASTTLEFGQFRLIHFNMNEAKHSIEVDGWYSWQWKDSRLAWNVTKYDKVHVLRVPADKVWFADIVLYSSVNWLNLDHQGKVHVLIYPDGSMLYVPPAHLESACVADMTYWPHDVHNCTIKLGSWTTDGLLLNVTLKDDKFNLEDFQQSKTSNLTRSEWELMSHKVSREVKFYTCCEEPYISIKFEMIIKRNAPALAYSFKLPAIGLSFLSLFVFLLPPGAGEKLLLSGLLLLMDLLFLIHTSDVVEYSPTHIPVVVQLVSQQLILVLVSVILSVVAVRMARPPHGEPFPSGFIGPLRALAPLLLLGKYSTKTYHPAVPGKDEVELGDSMTMPLDAGNKKEEHGDWILVAAIVDRILFILYFFIIISNLVAYSSVL